jgi:glycosyltransferase involved in cell wall biosynthesis
MSLSRARVSLVVPTVNRTAELTRLLESLLCQEFKDFEILIVDQTCDDKIVRVLNDYISQLNIRRIWRPAPGRRRKDRTSF